MKKRTYIIIALVSFLGFLLVAAPASLLVNLVRDDLSRTLPALVVGSVGGSVWQGQAQLQYGGFPPVTADWTLHPGPLLLGRAEMDISLDGGGLTGSLNGHFSAAGGRLQAETLTIDAGFINEVSAARGLTLTGEVSARGIDAAWDRSWVNELSGRVHWPGGLVHIQTPQQYYSASLPPLTGVFGIDAGVLRFAIDDEELQLVNIEFRRDGWARVDVTFDFMNLAGLPVPGAGSQNGQASAVIIEEKIALAR